ncbi:MAG: BrnT family toxin [Devosia sp.]|uniref:BrnT family toxin n=1 Tax=Devosia sp. TaxID=1871048 RepID=UPI0026393B01|nr:BrnT family toxin [Devosia sp.]MDB5538462.1 BrnT family toxin [Devosia sp.]
MDFEWDAGKRLANLDKHGVDFRVAIKIFEGPTIDRIDDRRDYGEERVISIGVFKGRVLVVVSTDRFGTKRIISAWKAGEREREAYRALLSR